MTSSNTAKQASTADEAGTANEADTANETGAANEAGRTSHERPQWFTSAIEQHARVETVQVDGVTISYRAWGERLPDSTLPSVVLLHGGAANARWWDHIAPLLSVDRQVIAFDLSGHGDSGRRDSYDLEGWATEALAIARLASGNDPILIGHSLGGVVALRAAMTAGDELGGIIIVDSPLVRFTPEEDAAAGRMAFGPPRVYPSKDAVIARFRPIPDQPSLDYVRDYIAAASVRESQDGWGWKFDSRIFTRAPQLPGLAPVHCRSAFFRGERGIVSREMADAIVERLGGETPMIDIADAGHAIMLDQPLALLAGLRTILALWD
jgi:pimeloyl-ACP methyl ester carboxylesterase